MTIAEAFDSALTGSAYWIGSWDGPDYRLDNENGDFGTVCFRDNSLIGLFFGHASQRSPWRHAENSKPLSWYLPVLSPPLTEALDQSAIPFLRHLALDNELLPVTAAFWGEESTMSAVEPWNDVFWNGAFLLATEMRKHDDATRELASRYEFSDRIISLLTDVASKKFHYHDRTLALPSSVLVTLSIASRLPEDHDRKSEALSLCQTLLAQIDIVFS